MNRFSAEQRASIFVGLPQGTVALRAGGLLIALACCLQVDLADAEDKKPTQQAALSVASDDVASSDFICGPRCAQYILKYYGRDVDLIELVREMQWPDLEGGTTMEAVDKALTKRGIHTFGMQISPDARLNWPHPVLVHMKVEGAVLGHFVVRLPSGTTAVWRGLQRIDWISDDVLAERRTGAILLTAPEAIADPGSAVERAGVPWFVWSLSRRRGLCSSNRGVGVEASLAEFHSPIPNGGVR